MDNEKLKKELLELKKQKLEEEETNRLKREINQLKKPSKLQMVGKISFNVMKSIGKMGNNFMKNQEKKYKSKTRTKKRK